ncbi:hypothetical protein V1506DRAFT_552591 [Lipomyces tetrasporus]
MGDCSYANSPTHDGAFRLRVCRELSRLMNIDQILNSSTLSAQSEGNDSGQTFAPAPDNASSASVTKSSPATSPRSISQRAAPQKESSPISQPRYVNSESQEESGLGPLNLPPSQPPQTPGGLPLQPLPPPQHHPPPGLPTAQQTYAYQQQYQQPPFQQYSPQSYYQPQRTGYQASTAHHVQPFQHHSQHPAYAVPQQGYSFALPQGYDRKYGEFSSSMRPWTPPRQERSSQSIQHSVSQENLAPPLDPGDGHSAYAYEGTGLRRVASDGDPQEESSTLAVRPKRRKAPNSTWTLEEDRKLVCLCTQD